MSTRRSWANDACGHVPIRQKPPLGLMDVGGNVWEWTDWYDEEKTSRWLRGGSWSDLWPSARVSARDNYSPHGSYNDVGFRVVAPVVS
ncbi:MAG: SUMF1/EgtB/PvdO family nonheme iron enzyme [Ardenticatenaceae bacterium]|nr:SUMF1/EgtB/PvdO family nonheme iron enzyme [Ardenticatenaceae bacterium]